MSLNLDVNLYRTYNYYLNNHSYLTANKNGFGSREGHAKKINFNKNAKEAVERHTKEGSSLYDENIENLKEIIAFTKKRGINLLLFTPPATKFYREKLNKHQLEKTIWACEALEKKNANVRYVNFLNNDDFLLEDFYDADHLNAKGAQKLSTLLNKMITE